MSYKLKDLKNYMHFSFGKEVEALLKYLGSTWDIKAQPKGYAAYKKDYKDFQDMEELDEEALLKSFDGHDSTGTLSGSFPLRISLPHVTYDDTNQGRRPLETLIGAVLGHGIHIGERLAAVNNRSDALRRLDYYSHVMTWFVLRNDSSDQHLGMLSLMEANEYKSELGTECEDIKAKYDEKRRVYLTAKLEDIRKSLKGDKGPVTFLNPHKLKSDTLSDTLSGTLSGTLNEYNRKSYEYLWEMFCLVGLIKEDKFKKVMSSLGMTVIYKDNNFTVSLKKKRVKKEAL